MYRVLSAIVLFVFMMVCAWNSSEKLTRSKVKVGL